MKKLKSKISLANASKMLEKPASVLFRKRSIQHMEEVYLPYYYFEVRIILTNNTTVEKAICVDGIDGEYAFIENKSFLITAENKKETNEEYKIDIDSAEMIARRAVKNNVIMKMKKGIKVKEVRCEFVQILEYPYWIGLYKKKDKIEFDALDAITGQKQGVKMRPVLLKMIMQ